MGEADRYSEYRVPKNNFILGQAGNPLVALITLNIIFFILLLTIRLIYFFFQLNEAAFLSDVFTYFQLPAQLSQVATKPWTIITYMFCHIGVIGMLSNMLWLWAFGYILQEITGNKKLIPVYIYGGLAGALFFIVAYYLIPPLKPAIASSFLSGSNAATMAVAAATTTLAPDYRFFKNLGRGIPIWILMLAYLLIDFSGVATFGAAYSLSHLGGALAGFVFAYFLMKDKDGSIWMNTVYERMANLFSPKQPKNKNVREKIFYKTGERKPYKKTSNLTQSKVDEILEKIHQKGGYEFLTDEEKNILKRAAEEDQ